MRIMWRAVVAITIGTTINAAAQTSTHPQTLDDATATFLGLSVFMIWVSCLVAIILGLIPAFIAKTKGRSFMLWHFYGFWLFPIALIHSIFLRPNDKALAEMGYVECPHCREMVKPGATVCPHCQQAIMS